MKKKLRVRDFNQTRSQKRLVCVLFRPQTDRRRSCQLVSDERRKTWIIEIKIRRKIPNLKKEIFIFRFDLFFWPNKAQG